MKLAIMQPYLFPYIGYLQLINTVDKFVIYDDVNYINRGWINRNNILINGKANTITLPLKEASQNKLINEIFITDEIKLIEKLLKTIELSYKKAPFFETVFPVIANILHSGLKNIAAFNTYALKKICAYLGITTKIIETSSIYNNSHLKSQERILDICFKENATHYINPIGGMEIYNGDAFNNNNIKLNFLKTDKIEYKQYNDAFIPSLSVIDVMMFNSPDDINKMLNKYELI